jgi:hypothetical protein
VHIGIKNLAFQPARIVISSGTEVVWTNLDAIRHALASNSGRWRSGALDAGEQFALVFKKVGTYHYHCTIHPFIHGIIVVRSQTRRDTVFFFSSLLEAGSPLALRLLSGERSTAHLSTHQESSPCEPCGAI